MINDLTEKQQMFAALEKNKEQLEILVQDRTRVLELKNKDFEKLAYIISHDLKAPLRGISSLCEFLQEDLEDFLKAENETTLKVVGHLEQIAQQSMRMESLIKGILEYLRIGVTETETDKVSVFEVCESISKDLQLELGSSIIINGDLPVLTANRFRLTQVFSNLISNAFQHHSQSSEAKITISANYQDSFFEFSIKDNGPGIDPKYHEKIFQMFHTLQVKEGIGNTGIGLTLVKRIISFQGGSIRLVSQEGKGCDFIFTWPNSID